MKELSIEEKAKAYDEALERAKECHIDGLSLHQPVKDVIEHIFPELKESEDEKIRKEMIFYFTEEIPQCSIQEHSDKMREFISWLKRQEVERTKLELKAGNSYFCYKSRWERADSETFKKGLIYKCNKDGVLDNFVIKNPEQHFIKIKDERIARLEKQKENIDNANKEYWRGYREGKQEIIDKYNELEKQGEQKVPVDDFKAKDWYVSKVDGKIRNIYYPIDKVEPKFHEGEWVVSNLDGKARQISEVHFDEYNSYYVVEGESVNLEEYDRLHHLWTIADAKDGDVLAVEAIENYPYPFVAIYKEHCLDFFNSYCFIGFNGKFYESETGHSMDKIHPATKEQCNLLFAKMKEFGYEWDAKKKELKKIEQKSAWSEEDERNLEGIIDEIEANKNFAPDSDLVTYDRFLSWLKSLKDRVQPQYKWSKEDGHVSEDLNIAAREYSYIKGAENIDEYAQYDFEKYNAFKAGAKWQSKQM